MQLQLLESRTRRLERWLHLSACGWLLTFGVTAVSAWTWQPEKQQQQPAAPVRLRVSELVVVDPKGAERVRIGGELPDAVIGGKRVPRGERAAGVLLYDGAGQERSGYVTFEPSGNVGLTLDTRRGQVAYFVAGPDSGSALQLWHGGDLIELRSDQDGSRLTAARAGQVVAQEPVVAAMSAGTCEAYHGARSRVPREQVMRDCRRRFTEATCKACLGEPRGAAPPSPAFTGRSMVGLRPLKHLKAREKVAVGSAEVFPTAPNGPRSKHYRIVTPARKTPL